MLVIKEALRNTEIQYILKKPTILYYLAKMVVKAVRDDLNGVFDGCRKTFR